MKGIGYILSFLACLGMFMVMMRVKGDVSVLLRERRSLAREQLQLNEDLRVLRAEYAHLANLARLTGMAEVRGFQKASLTQLLEGSF